MLVRFDDDHEEAVVALVRQFHAEATTYNTEPFDADVVRKYYRFCAHSPDGFGMMSIREDGTVTGFMAGGIGQTLFNTDKMSYDLSLYVAPEYRRKAGIALRLVKEYIEWARSKGVKDKFIRIGVSAGIDNAHAGDFLERLGFVEVAKSYALGGAE